MATLALALAFNIILSCGHTEAGSRVCSPPGAAIEDWGLKVVARVSCDEEPQWCARGLCCAEPPGTDSPCSLPDVPGECGGELLVLCVGPWTEVEPGSYTCAE